MDGAASLALPASVPFSILQYPSVLLYNSWRADVVCRRERETLDNVRSRSFISFQSFHDCGLTGAAVWLFVSGQAGTVDGLFLVLTALLSAAVFALYVKFVIGRHGGPEAAPAPAPRRRNRRPPPWAEVRTKNIFAIPAELV